MRTRILFASFILSAIFIINFSWAKIFIPDVSNCLEKFSNGHEQNTNAFAYREDISYDTLEEKAVKHLVSVMKDLGCEVKMITKEKEDFLHRIECLRFKVGSSVCTISANRAFFHVTADYVDGYSGYVIYSRYD